MMKSKKAKGIVGLVLALLTALGIGVSVGNVDNRSKENAETEHSTNASNENNHNDNINKEYGELEIHYIDVGQGDATLIKCDGQSMLIDAGENDMGTKVYSYLISQGIEKLDYVIGTHPDSDHIGGMDVVLYNFQCDKVFMPDFKKDTKTYDDVINTAKNKNYKITNPQVGDVYTLGNGEFTIIAPNKKYDEANNASIGIYFAYGERTFLFTGDAEYEAELDIIANGLNIDADVYKAGHHGSRTSSSDELLEKVTPKYVVVSCGEDNSYGHPHAAILNYCIFNKIPMYRTDLQGTIVLKCNGKEIEWNMSPAEF